MSTTIEIVNVAHPPLSPPRFSSPPSHDSVDDDDDNNDNTNPRTPLFISPPSSPSSSHLPPLSYLIPSSPPRKDGGALSLTIVPAFGDAEEEKSDCHHYREEEEEDAFPAIIPIGHHTKTLSILSEDMPLGCPSATLDLELAPTTISTTSTCGPMADEPIITLPHILAFSMVVFTEAMITGR